MEIDDNKNSNYYIKEIEDKEHVKHNVFYVNKNIFINKKMLKEIEKYNCKIVEFCDKFKKPIENLPSNIQNIVFGSNFNHRVDSLCVSLKKGKHNVTFHQFNLMLAFSFSFYLQ